MSPTRASEDTRDDGNDLQDSDSVYRAFFERNLAVKLLIDAATGRIVDANPAACEFYGWARRDLLSRSIQDINCLPRDEVQREMNLAQDEEKGLFFFDHRLANGEIRSVEVHSGPIEINGRRLLFSIVHDITERRQAELALQQSEERYRSLFHQSKDAVYITSPEGRMLDINEAGMKLFGYASRDEILELDLASDLYVEPRQRERLLATVEKNGYAQDFETRLRTRDGRHLTVLATTSAIHDEDDSVTAYLGILRDVTQERHLEEQLRQSQRMEAAGQLAGGMAHSFNNLLTTIMGYADLLDRVVEEERARTFLQQILQAGRRASELTAELTTISRRRTFHPEVVQLNDVVRRLSETLPSMLGGGIRLSSKLGEPLPRVRVDVGQLEQAILNLALNARDAMPEGGALHFGTRVAHLPGDGAPTQWVEFAVTDSGPGVPPEIRDRIFDPFFTTKKSGAGSGLGLSTTHAIITQSSGRIFLDEPDQGGATFRILLPPYYEGVPASG